jgi:polyisoprenyl-phosphate glycosyltransferase
MWFMHARDRLSVVVPVYNEQGNLRLLHETLAEQFQRLEVDYELLFVDDGSRDDSLRVLRELHELDPSHVKVISLSRNFGHQNALTAGLEHATGDAVIAMDADLQHPPELIPEMVAQWRAGYQVVFTIRCDGQDLGWFKRWSSRAFYALINKITDTPIVPGAADFRLVDRQVVDSLNSMQERARFLRGLVSWVGFRQVGLPYQVRQRHDGQSKYSLRKMLGLALNGVTNFSAFPLRLATYFGFLSAVIGIPYAIWAVYARLFTNSAVPGWASLTTFVLFLGGVQLICLGIIGEYLGRVYDEVKRRPLYVPQELIGFDDQTQIARLAARRWSPARQASFPPPPAASEEAA